MIIIDRGQSGPLNLFDGACARLYGVAKSPKSSHETSNALECTNSTCALMCRMVKEHCLDYSRTIAFFVETSWLFDLQDGS